MKILLSIDYEGNLADLEQTLDNNDLITDYEFHEWWETDDEEGGEECSKSEN